MLEYVKYEKQITQMRGLNECRLERPWKWAFVNISQGDCKLMGVMATSYLTHLGLMKGSPIPLTLTIFG